MKTVFISQPMNGRTDDEILLERENAVLRIQAIYDGEEIQILDSFMRGAPHDANPVWFLGKAIEFLSMADVAYFVDGWQNARGCTIEHQVAKAYGISYIDGGEA